MSTNENPDDKLVIITAEEDILTPEELHAKYAPSWATEGNYTFHKSDTATVATGKNTVVSLWQTNSVAYLWKRNLTPEETAVQQAELKTMFNRLMNAVNNEEVN